MIAPWQETQFKVVLEFKKGNSGVSRVINLAHRKEVLPPQLQGRVAPETWAAFMQEMEALSRHHPYVVRQDVGQCCWNLQGVLCFLCIGFGIMNPDGGNYGVWTREVNDCCAHYNPTFAAGGANAHLRNVQGAWWVEINIDPNMAVGIASLPPPPNPYDTTKPSSAAPGGYPPPADYPPAYPPTGYPPANNPPPGYLPAGAPQPGYGSNAPPQPGYGYPSQAPPAGYPSQAPAGYPAPQDGYGASAAPQGYGQPSAYPTYPPAPQDGGYPQKTA